MDLTPLNGIRLYRDVETYDHLGEHRSGSKVDNCTAEWLATELARTGCQVDYQNFFVPYFDSNVVHLCLDGGIILKAFPLWPVKPTTPQGVSGQLVHCEQLSEHKDVEFITDTIVVTRQPYGQHPCAIGITIQAAAAAGARGVIVITEGPTGEIIAINAPSAMPQWPIPVALVGQKDEAVLDAGTQLNQLATLLIDGQYRPNTTAQNVLAHWNQGASKQIVVMTPHSGWFHCSGERGPGIAILLGLARFVAINHLKASFTFVSASGHELGMLGENLFISEAAPKPDEVALWLHLGASIATQTQPSTSEQNLPTQSFFPDHDIATHAELLPEVLKHLNFLSGESQPVEIGEFLKKIIQARQQDESIYGNAVTFDERDHLAYLKAIHAGYKPLLMLAGTHEYFHTPSDRALTTNPRLLELFGIALANIIAGIVLN